MKATRVIIPLEDLERHPGMVDLEQKIQNIDGVVFCRLEPAMSRVTLELKHSLAFIEVVKMLRKASFPVSVMKQKFPVLEMSCAACSGAVENALRETIGVVEVSVNYAQAVAMIQYIPSVVSSQSLRTKLRSLGYDLVVGDTLDVAAGPVKWTEQRIALLKTNAIWSLVFSLPVVILGMFFSHLWWSHWVMLALTTPVIFYFGIRFFRNAWRLAQHRSLSMDSLVAMSTGTAYVYSFWNSVSSILYAMPKGHSSYYYESVCVILSFIQLGRFLEEKAKAATSSSIRQLINFQPKKVQRINAVGLAEWIAVEDVQVGNQLLVRPGDRIAVDGNVQEGFSYVDEQALVGEPIPRFKEQGHKLLAGSINLDGQLLMTATQVGKETLLAHIIRLVEDAQGTKAISQKLADRIAAIFVPVVFILAVASAIVWSIYGGNSGMEMGIVAFVTVLIVACPCALGLATPTAITVGIGKAAARGILIKHANGIEHLEKVNSVVMDKTGTLTKGKPVVSDVFSTKKIHEEEILLFNLALLSSHVLSHAIVLHWSGLKKIALDQFINIPGRGCEAKYALKNVLLGSLELMKDRSIRIAPEFMKFANDRLAMAQTLVWFAIDDEVKMVIAVEDEINPTALSTIQSLAKMGISTYLLTGDHELAAQSLATQLGIPHVHASMNPDQKAEFIKKLQDKGNLVAMVGDGINDSAALAQADVSIAMGQGSEIAQDVAQITLLSSDLMKIPLGIKISRQTVQTLRQNLFWAFIYNLLSIPVAAGILYPINGFLLDPMIAGIAMAFSSVSVVSNSLVLKYRPIN